jgi:hypothetical protein
MVVDFNATTLTWKCRDPDGTTSDECMLLQERCGDGTVNGDEICDGINTSMCGVNQQCDLSCACVA